MARVDSAGSLLRDARQRAALTQVQLGQRAGVTQSVVSAYESGHRQPSLPTLLSLLAATGHTLDASLVATSDLSPTSAVMPADTSAAAGPLSSTNPSVRGGGAAAPGSTAPSRDVPSRPRTNGPTPPAAPTLAGPLGRRVRRHQQAITATAARYGVSRVRVIGSVARSSEGPDSDVDLLLDVPADMGLFALGRLRTDLELLLGAPVDLVPAEGLKDEVRLSVEADAMVL